MRTRHPSNTARFESLEPRALLASNGLFGQYYDDANLAQLRMTRQDIAVDFDFGNASPVQPQMSADTFSVRWSGQIQPEFGETYTFHVTADDGVRLWVRGQLLIDRWSRADQIAGDANRDGVVNLTDFNTLAENFGAATGATWGMGDFNGDGAVNLTDFNSLASNFGRTAPTGPRTDTGTIALTAGQKVDVKLEYFDQSGAASVNLKWSSASQPVEVIPQARLFSLTPPPTFNNPVIGSGADPWVTRWNNQYVYVRSNGAAVYVAKSQSLQGIGAGASIKVWDPPAGLPYSHNVWAPELHYLDGRWYIYVAADDGDNANHRMYVLEGNTQDPAGSYTFKGKIAATTDRWAIDGTVLEHDQSRYFVWSGWPGTTDGQQNLYIARMSNAWTITGDRVQISAPTLAWERYGLALNEGPTVLKKDGTVHLIYSASGYWRPEYSLGQLTLGAGANPMFGSAWTKKPTPVFTRTSAVAGVGHASFTESPDGSEDWIVYHAHQNPVEFTGRDVRAQAFTWNPDHSPSFGQPINPSTPIVEPSGTPTFYTGTASAASPPQDFGDVFSDAREIDETDDLLHLAAAA